MTSLHKQLEEQTQAIEQLKDMLNGTPEDDQTSDEERRAQKEASIAGLCCCCVCIPPSLITNLMII